MKERLIIALAEAFEMEPSVINPDHRFRDYEQYSSLTELSVLAMLDSEFNVSIEMTEFNNYHTVNDLIGLISKNT
jgi:acyl carrier protein